MQRLNFHACPCLRKLLEKIRRSSLYGALVEAKSTVQQVCRDTETGGRKSNPEVHEKYKIYTDRKWEGHFQNEPNLVWYDMSLTSKTTKLLGCPDIFEFDQISSSERNLYSLGPSCVGHDYGDSFSVVPRDKRDMFCYRIATLEQRTCERVLKFTRSHGKPRIPLLEPAPKAAVLRDSAHLKFHYWCHLMYAYRDAGATMSQTV